MIKKLSDAELDNALPALTGWTQHADRHALCQSFKFQSFRDAWGFMTKIALLAEQMNHHPEWSNIYNRVDILLTTHDVSGISERDIKMAQKINSF